MSEFFPTGVIHKATTPYQFRFDPKRTIDNIIIQSESDTLSFEGYLRKLHISSLIVVHKDTIVYEKYFSMLPEDKHTLQSVNKVITSTLVTHSINEKKIDRNQAIEKYIPD